MQDGALEAALARLIHQEFEYRLPDTVAAQLLEYRHPPDFDFVVAVRDGAPASNRSPVDRSEGVNRAIVVFVHFDFFGDVLLFYEYPPSNRIGLIHLRGGSHQYDASTASHIVHYRAFACMVKSLPGRFALVLGFDPDAGRPNSSED